MRFTLKSLMSRFARDEKGATLVEYGIAVVLAVVVGTGGLIFMANQVDSNMGTAQQAMIPNSGAAIVDVAP
jgi:Flp pilus assembly pilin Flp